MSTEDVIISQPTGTRTLALRESYLAICDGDKCEAHLLNSLERWYAYKLKNRRQARHANRTAEAGGEAATADEGLWVFMSAQEWVTELLNQYDEKTVRTKLARLVERGFVNRRSNPTRRWDRKPQWLFHRSAVQAAVDAWGAGRNPLDLDPEGPDGTRQAENPEQDNSGIGTETIRAFSRMHSGEVPDASGQMPASIRANARSNTTGISHRDLPQESITGGEHNVTSNAHANQEPAAPVVGLTGALVTTTLVAAREPQGCQTPPVGGGQTQPASMVAVVSPDGEAADAAITDAELKSLFGNQAAAMQQTGTVTEVQEVPGGPAAPCGAQEAQEGPSSSNLVPHDPEETRAVLKAALGGLKKLTDLMDETPPGLPAGGRRGWVTRITPERAAEIIAAARIEAKSDNPWTFVIRHLDMELGAQIKRGGSNQGSTVPTVTPNGASLQAAIRPEVVIDVAPTNMCSVGARWQAYVGGEIVTIVRISPSSTRGDKATLYHLSNGQNLKSFELMSRYSYIEASR